MKFALVGMDRFEGIVVAKTVKADKPAPCHLYSIDEEGL